MDWTFNIFRVADIYHSEEIHTRIIAELINPKSTFHNNGKRFLKEFAESMEFSKYNINLDYDKAFVETNIIAYSKYEWKRRIYLIICDYCYYIPFEVRIHLREQDRPNYDPLGHADKMSLKVPVLFYLNRDGKEPRNTGVSDLNKQKIQTVTFNKQIVDWLIRCNHLCGVPTDVRVIMMHLIENIDGSFTKGDCVIDSIRDGLFKHNYECLEDTGRFLTYRLSKEHPLVFALRITRDGEKIVLCIICGIAMDGGIDFRYDNTKAYIEKSDRNMDEYEALFERTFNDKSQLPDWIVINKAINPYRWDKLEQSNPLIRVIDRLDDIDAIFAHKCIGAVERLLETILVME